MSKAQREQHHPETDVSDAIYCSQGRSLGASLQPPFTATFPGSPSSQLLHVVTNPKPLWISSSRVYIEAPLRFNGQWPEPMRRIKTQTLYPIPSLRFEGQGWKFQPLAMWWSFWKSPSWHYLETPPLSHLFNIKENHSGDSKDLESVVLGARTLL